MILEYGFRNFLSFKDGATVSFRLDRNVPTNISGKKDYATIACVKGANGSGKTHLLKALAFISYFIHNSFSSPVDSPIPIDSFGNNNEISDFYIDFRIEKEDYRYELSATTEKVFEEKLYRTKNRKTRLFERKDGVVTYATSEFSKLKTIKLRNNSSIISTAYQHEIDELRPIYNFFRSIRFNVTTSGVVEYPFGNTAKQLNENKNMLSQVIDFIKSCDTGIIDIKIASEEASDGNIHYFPIFIHDAGDVKIHVRDKTESRGTKQLFHNILVYFDVLRTGSILIIDEFDLYLHPFILPKLLELFTKNELNKKGAQILFTTHQTEIIDICGKYRTHLVNKENNFSYVYRLDEIPGDMLRNDRTIVNSYKEGRIGGVPKL